MRPERTSGRWKQFYHIALSIETHKQIWDYAYINMFSISYIASAEVRYKLKTNIQLSAVKRTPIELI